MACCQDRRSCCGRVQSHKKDSVWAWLVCVAAATNLAFTVGLIYSFGVLLPVFMEYFKENRERTAWVGSLSIAVSLGCGPFVGSFLNRFGCRKVSIAGSVTCAVSLTIASFANDLAILYVCYAFLGAGVSCVSLSSLEIVRKCFDKRRSIALGITSAGQGMGTMVLSQILQSLVSSLGWKNSLRVVGGCLALNSFFGLLYDSKIDTASISEMHTNEEAGQRRTSKRFTFHCSVWRVPSFLVLTVVFVFAMFGRAIVFVHLVKYSEDCGMSFNESSRLLLFMGIQIVVGRFACGFLCSYRRLNNWYISQTLLLLSGTSTILLSLAQNYEAFIAYVVLFGFCDGAWATVNNIQALTCVDQSRAASAYGFILLAASVTSMVGPPLSGLAADKLDSFGPAFYMAGGALLVASVVPCALRCVKSATSSKENDRHIQEVQIHSNDTKPNEGDHILFISTV